MLCWYISGGFIELVQYFVSLHFLTTGIFINSLTLSSQHSGGIILKLIGQDSMLE
jgi:hypothetical protein